MIHWRRCGKCDLSRWKLATLRRLATVRRWTLTWDFAVNAERVAELIGEAATRLPEERRDAWPEVPWKPMISMRNWLIHGYDGIDAEILWDVLDLRSGELIGQLDEIIEALA